MFRSQIVRLVALAVLVVCFIAANTVNAQCNSGVSTQQAQVSANQQLVLQQTAAIAAQQQAQQATVTTRSRSVSSFPVSQPLALSTGQPACTSCQQNQVAIRQPQPSAPVVAAVPPLPTGPQPMMLVRTTPPSGQPNSPVPARYVLMSGDSRGVPIQLAAR